MSLQRGFADINGIQGSQMINTSSGCWWRFANIISYYRVYRST